MLTQLARTFTSYDWVMCSEPGYFAHSLVSDMDDGALTLTDHFECMLLQGGGGPFRYRQLKVQLE